MRDIPADQMIKQIKKRTDVNDEIIEKNNRMISEVLKHLEEKVKEVEPAEKKPVEEKTSTSSATKRVTRTERKEVKPASEAEGVNPVTLDAVPKTEEKQPETAPRRRVIRRGVTR